MAFALVVKFALVLSVDATAVAAPPLALTHLREANGAVATSSSETMSVAPMLRAASSLSSFTTSLEPESPLPPGGYRTLGELREREPPDGREALIVGSTLSSLGVLRAGAGLAMVIAGSSSRCPDGQSGYLKTEDDCQAFRTYGLMGVGFGGVLLVTGGVYLVMAAVARHRHRRWRINGGGWTAHVDSFPPRLRFGVASSP